MAKYMDETWSIPFVGSKRVNWEFVRAKLQLSESANRWTNFGPVSKELETRLEIHLRLPPSLKVVMCSSATTGLHTLVKMCEILRQSTIPWFVPSFSFPCAVSGALQNAQILDCDSSGMLTVENIESGSGVVITNLFCSHNCLETLRTACSERDITMIVDSALAFDNIEHGPYEVISFHHTKPWGIGEGGCAIVPREHEEIFRSLINFGFDQKTPASRSSTNGKLSDISAAFIWQRLEQMANIEKEFFEQYERVSKIGLGLGVQTWPRDNRGTLGFVPFLFPRPVLDVDHPQIALRKYYRPLANTPNATFFFERMVAFPCHLDLRDIADEQIKYLIIELIRRSRRC